MAQPLAIDSLASSVLLTYYPKQFDIIYSINGILVPPPILSTECNLFRSIPKDLISIIASFKNNLNC